MCAGCLLVIFNGTTKTQTYIAQFSEVFPKSIGQITIGGNMRLFIVKKKDVLWWLGIMVFWSLGRFFFALPEFTKSGRSPVYKANLNYLIEGIIASSLSVIIIGVLRNVKDEVKVRKVLGAKFVWHKKYIWHWLGFTILFGIGRSLLNVVYDLSPNFVVNIIKGAIIFSLVYIIAGFWEGNPSFFESGIKRNDNSGNHAQ